MHRHIKVILCYEDFFNKSTLAFGAYEDDCHLKPSKLPFGFGDFNIPSTEEVTGQVTVVSVTWNNNVHGTSAEEEEFLDQVI